MGKSDLTSPLSSVTFRCKGCRHTFEGHPDRVEDAPEQTWHPWAYFKDCDICGDDAPQAHWEINLFKGWVSDRTPEGLAASAANLDGHPTPEEARRTRFNAMKHGLYARVANYFPARPGGYIQCDGCEHLTEESCRPYNACLKRTELFMKHQAAFDTRDPKLLTMLRSDTQAAIQAMINDMILSIAQDGGTRLKTPEYYYDKDGGLHWVKYTDENGDEHQIMKVEAHALLKPLIDFISKNNMTLEDMEMTPKVQDEQETLKGFLANDAEREQASAYQKRLEQQNSVLLELIKGSYQDIDTSNAIEVQAERVSDG